MLRVYSWTILLIFFIEIGSFSQAMSKMLIRSHYAATLTKQSRLEDKAAGEFI